MNPNSILFLYEGETEGEFYKFFFDQFPSRKIRIYKSNLKGVYSLNNKVSSKIKSYLASKKFEDCIQIHVFVAFDREGSRDNPCALDVGSLEHQFVGCNGARVVSINPIIATQDLESWFFHDLKGIYKFLGTPKSKANLKAYRNPDATNNRILSDLFHRFGKHYQKGRRVEGFLKSLDLKYIIDTVPELKEAKNKISALIKG